MLPTLHIPVKNFELMEAYVAEIEGFSGSLIWVRPTAHFNAAQEDGGEEKTSLPLNGDTDLTYWGLLHGRWEISKGAVEGQNALYAENMISGMSIIVPARKILEVINQEELVTMRKKIDEVIS